MAAGRFENQKTNRDYPNYSFVVIGQNIEENSGDLRSVAVSQTPVRLLANAGVKNSLSVI